MNVPKECQRKWQRWEFIGNPKKYSVDPCFHEHEHIASVVRPSPGFFAVLVFGRWWVLQMKRPDWARKAGRSFCARNPIRQGRSHGSRGLICTWEMFWSSYHSGWGWTTQSGRNPWFCGWVRAKPERSDHGRTRFYLLPFVRMCSNTIGTWMFSWRCNSMFLDNQSDTGSHPARLMKAMLSSHQSMGLNFEVEMILRCIFEKQKNWVGFAFKPIYADEHSHNSTDRHGWPFILLTISTRK